MTDMLTIDEVVRRTGLTARALRFYEARRLVQPLRTDSGRRVYAAGDLERLHQVVALKKAGLSLLQISRLFGHKPIDLPTILRAQQGQLKARIADETAALHLINTALSRIDRGEPLDAETLCSLIRNGDNMMTDASGWKAVIAKHFTPEQQAEWQARMTGETPFQDQRAGEDYARRWRELGARIEEALPLAPDSPEALGFVREWLALLEPFTRRASPEMWTATAQFYEKMEDWQDQWNPGFSKAVWLFIGEATRVARAAGRDVGFLPEFMKTGA
jgi:DNA-binding transcriptional MerR regulator